MNENEMIDTKGMVGLQELMGMIQDIESQGATFMIDDMLTKGGEPLCGAVPAYRPKFSELIAAAQRAMDSVSSFCETQVRDLTKAIEIFEHHKLEAMAECPFDECSEREEARRELGWDGENPNLL